MTRYVIVGNGVAGTTAAEEIRKLDETGSITIVSDEDVPFYYRIRLPEILADEVPEQKIIANNVEWFKEHSIDLYLQTTVSEIDANSKTLLTQKGEKIDYDKLLLANGSHSFIPPIPGSDLPGVFALRSIQDARDIRKWAETSSQIILIGGGVLGLEAGNGLRKLGKDVTVIEVLPRLLPMQLDVEAASRLQAMLEEMGFSFRLGTKTTSITGKGFAEGVSLDDGQSLPADLVLISAGVRPNLDLARQMDLELNKGIKVDAFLQTSRQDVYAAGDVTEFQDRVYGIWPAAEDQGRIAGRNMAGKQEPYHGTVMSNILKVVGIDLASAGEIDVDGQYESRVHSDNDLYRKIVLQENKIIGCIMLGSTKGFQTVLKLMKEQKDVSDSIDSILTDV
jgi:nitrite reductase (NADH) large subunit